MPAVGVGGGGRGIQVVQGRQTPGRSPVGPARRAAPGRKAAACRPPPCPVTSQTCPVTSRSRRRLIACNDARCSVCSRRQAQHRRFSNSRLGPNGRRSGPVWSATGGRRRVARADVNTPCRAGRVFRRLRRRCSRVCGARL